MWEVVTSDGVVLSTHERRFEALQDLFVRKGFSALFNGFVRKVA